MHRTINHPAGRIRRTHGSNGHSATAGNVRLAPDVARHRFTVDDYCKMDEAGILDIERGKFELLDGDIIYMPAPGPDHAEMVDRLNAYSTDLAGKQVRVRCQNPVRLGDYSLPEPDLTLLTKKSYRAGHPTPDDVMLVIEVADSSLKKDRELKLPLYAQAGIREVWIVNVSSASVEVYRQPRGKSYRKRAVFDRPTDVITADALPELRIALGELFA